MDISVAPIELSERARSFMLMTVWSVSILYFVPQAWRQHMKKFGTYVHELCHGASSFLTGGRFHRFHVRADGGGLCVTSGGNPKIITAAGYVGTVLVGALLISQSVSRFHAAIFLRILAALAALSVRKAGDYHTATVGLTTASLLGFWGVALPGSRAAGYMMNAMGVTLTWHGIDALIVLTRVSAKARNTGSDAEVLGRMTHMHPLLWAISFCLAGILIFAVFLRWILG